MREFTGYVIKEDYDLNNLKTYGFRTSEEKNIWWQRTFNVKWDRFFGTWDCELLVNKKDRKLYRLYKYGCNMDEINRIFEEMMQDGILVNE